MNKRIAWLLLAGFLLALAVAAQPALASAAQELTGTWRGTDDNGKEYVLVYDGRWISFTSPSYDDWFANMEGVGIVDQETIMVYETFTSQYMFYTLAQDALQIRLADGWEIPLKRSGTNASSLQRGQTGDAPAPAALSAAQTRMLGRWEGGDETSREWLLHIFPDGSFAMAIHSSPGAGLPEGRYWGQALVTDAGAGADHGTLELIYASGQRMQLPYTLEDAQGSPLLSLSRGEAQLRLFLIPGSDGWGLASAYQQPSLTGMAGADDLAEASDALQPSLLIEMMGGKLYWNLSKEYLTVNNTIDYSFNALTGALPIALGDINAGVLAERYISATDTKDPPMFYVLDVDTDSAVDEYAVASYDEVRAYLKKLQEADSAIVQYHHEEINLTASGETWILDALDMGYAYPRTRLTLYYEKGDVRRLITTDAYEWQQWMSE